MSDNLAKHRERCERWPIERVEAKETLLLFICRSLRDIPDKHKRLERVRLVRQIYEDKLMYREVDKRQAAYDARWGKK